MLINDNQKMGLKRLNKLQEEQLKGVLGFYKNFYICNTCGSAYASDYAEKKAECLVCESAREKKQGVGRGNK